MYLLNKIEYWARKSPDHPAIVFSDDSWSFEKLRSAAHHTSYLLAEVHRVTAGDRVAYLGLNHPSMLILLLACERLGAIFTPFNSRLAEEEYNYLLRDSEPKVCYVDPAFERVAATLENNDCPMIPLEDLNHSTDQESHPGGGANDQSALLLVYTSGTTGKPKGVLLSQHAVKTNIDNCNALYNFKHGDRVQITLPLFHVGGLCILLLPALTEGATIHLHRSFDPIRTLHDIEENQLMTSIFVPAQMAAMMVSPAWETCDLSSMKFVAAGSSIIPKKQIQNFHQKNIPVSQIYGATETGPTAIGLAIEDAFDHEGTAGKPAKYCDIEIRTTDGRICDANENGEIWVKGENLFMQYWRNQAETEKVLVNDWYNTGDIGHHDNAGFYWIVDRAKDMIISGGENIYPAEVEAVSLEHPAIASIAVVGKPDEIWGETPVAAVELNEGHTLTLDGYHEFLKPKLARYKQPKLLHIFDQLPRNAMGKIEKSSLRNMINK